MTSSPRLLAIDTSTEACSAALLLDGEVTERWQLAPRAHAELILPMVEELLAAAGVSLAGLDAVAFARGPGAFTGLRIATGVVQGLSFAADRPVVAVSTLAALALGAARQHGAQRVLAALDARMNEVYWGAYLAGDDGLVGLQGEERVCRPEEVPVLGEGGWFGAGSGWAAYAEPLAARLSGSVSATDGGLLPRAGDVARLAAHRFTQEGGVPAAEALPIYLRNEVVQAPPIAK